MVVWLISLVAGVRAGLINCLTLLLTWLPFLGVHQLDYLGVVGTVLDDVEEQLGPGLLEVAHHLHVLLRDAGGPEHSSEEDDQHQQLHQGDVPVIPSLEQY